MSNLITNYNVNINGVKQDLGTIIQNNSTQTINIPTSGVTNSTTSLCLNPNGQQVIYDNSIYPSMSGSSVNGNTSISFGEKKRYGDNGMWVAVGTGPNNSIAYSSDGINWTGLGSTIFSDGGNGVVWNGTIWVAVGQGTNTIAYSYDGINWTGLGGYMFWRGRDIAWNGKIFVATGQRTNESGARANTIAYSSDGINWKAVEGSTSIFSSSGNGVAWNGQRFVVVGSGASGASYGQNTIAYSPDGSNNWTGVQNSKTQIFTGYGLDVAWNGTRFVAVGSPETNTYVGNKIAYSSDGITWNGVTNSIFTYSGDGIAWNGKIWVAVGNGNEYSIAYSYDGITWTGVTGSTPNIFYNGCGVTWNGTIWVAVGGGTNMIAYSSDGINWTGVTGWLVFFSSGRRVAWGGSNLPHTITFPRNLTLAGGSGTNSIASSPDGINWTRVDNSLNQCNGIAWNGTIWVAVGTGKSGKGPIAYSYDGSNNWTDTSSNVFTIGNGIAWNGKIWVAVGSGSSTRGSIAYSYDGITWTDVSGSYNILTIGRNVAWNGKIWVAVGKGGTHSIANSFDGINWVGVTSTFLPNTNGANAIAWNGTIWVAGGFPPSGGKSIAYSYDGSNNWTSGTATNFCTTSCKRVAWNGYKWVAGGEGGNQLATSSDGINWADFYSNFTECNGITWNETLWVAVGKLQELISGVLTNRTIAYSTDGITWISIANSNTIFSVGGNAVAYNQNIPSVKIQHPTIAVGEGTNSIAYSPDGIKWTGLGNTIFTTGRGVAWNGTRWVAVGSGTNTIAYSSDGIIWTPVTDAYKIFETIGLVVAWNGKIWVAIGTGSKYKIAYSYDGITWNGVTGSADPNMFFSGCNSVAWNGTMWVAIGNKISSSTDGIIWSNATSITNIFSITGYNIAWNGKLWVAVGFGSQYTIAYSVDAITWVGVRDSTGIFSYGYGLAWNGTRWVAVGYGASSFAHSLDGINWSGVTGTNSIFLMGLSVTWNGVRFVAGGRGPNTIAYSSDGITWTGVPNSTSIFSNFGFGVAGNPKVGAVIVPSAIHLNNNINSNTLTFSSESYYQSGVNNITIDVNTMY